MQLPPSLLALLSLLLLPSSSLAAESKPAEKPCTIHSPTSGSFYDLRPLQALNISHFPKSSQARNESWHARGYDYPANFTLNFCGPVIEDLEDVSGISSSRSQNVSAFYRDPSTSDIMSIGQQNSVPIFRGKKLVLNYTNGSPCPDLDEDGTPISARAILDDDDNDKDKDKDTKKPSKSKTKISPRHKSTLLLFTCDTSPTALDHPSISFAGAPDHCTYVFEVRSRYACAGTTPSSDSGSLGPGGVFGIILAITFLVYMIGGCVYSRTVLHQRGWKQIPNYALWSGIVGFIGDITTILFSSCRSRLSFSRLFGSSSGYHRVGTDDYRTAGRGRTPDDDDEENRLIDRLDEEWED